MIFEVGFPDILYYLLAVVIALTCHEFGHAYAAYKCGDNTARNFGRLTLDPLKHIDIFGFLSMLLVGFGWAKPVPINIRNMRKPRRDVALVSLAGPAMNFLLAFIGTFFFMLMRTLIINIYCKSIGGLYYYIYETAPIGLKFLENAEMFFWYFMVLNVGLGVFNLIPIPPLDGSKVVSSLLPPKIGYKYMMLERYAGIFILVLFVLSRSASFDFLFTPIEWLRDTIISGFEWVFGLLPFIKSV